MRELWVELKLLMMVENVKKTMKEEKLLMLECFKALIP